MKQQELRVGNYINCNNKLDVLQTVGAWCHTDLTAEENPLDQMKPIEINPDWLINLGFYETSYDTFAIGLPFGMGTDLILEKSLIKGFDTLLNLESTHIYLKDVHYIHELQNLFYGLSGKDLELKDSFLKHEHPELLK